MNIYEIAKLSGVSPATVSRVINESSKVSEKTRAKVLEVIKQKNYTPSVIARNLSSGFTKKVGIICKNIADSFYANAISLVENELRSFGYDSLLYTSLGDTREKLDGISRLSKEVDALVFIGSIFDPFTITKNNALRHIAVQTPIIIVNGYIEGHNIVGVVSDESAAMQKIITQFRCCGFQHPLYIHDYVSTYSGHSKMSGYKNALRDFGYSANEPSVLQVTREFDKSQDIISNYIDNSSDFDSIITSEDLFAVAALRVLNLKNMTRPVVSFNNSILSICSYPQITSVDFMLDTMCSTAINMLSKILEGKAVPEKIIVQPNFVVRESFNPSAYKTVSSDN